LTVPVSLLRFESTAIRETSGTYLETLSIRVAGDSVVKEGSATPKSGVKGKINGSVKIQTLII